MNWCVVPVHHKPVILAFKLGAAMSFFDTKINNPLDSLYSLSCTFYILLSGGFSGDDESFRAQRYVRFARRHVHSQNQKEPLKYTSHVRPQALAARRMPSTLSESLFRQVPQDRLELGLLARTDDEVHMENMPISTRHIVTMVSAFWGHGATAAEKAYHDE